METKTNYCVGDTIEFKYAHQTKRAKITNIGKAYISCGDNHIFLKETHKCVGGMWQIVGVTEPEKRVRMKPRGRSWKEQGIVGRTPKTTN